MNNRRRQHGATLVLTVVTLSAALGMAALAVDLGVIYVTRQRGQAVADAAALAGGQLLPDTAGASAAAHQIIAANGGQGASFTPTVSFPASVTRDDGTMATVGAGNAVVVQGTAEAPLAFAGASGTRFVPAEAAVLLASACGLPAGVGVAPFALIGDDPNNADPTAQYVARLLTTAANAQTPSPKTYQPVTSYGGQPLVLRQSVWNSNGTLVFAGNFDPTQFGGSQGYATGINHTSDAPLAAGQSLTPQAGATISLTQQYLGARLSPSNTQFRHDYTSYTDWFFGNHSLPVDTSKTPVTDPNTGQTYSYHQDPSRQELTDARVLIVPVVSQSAPNGTGPVTVLAFASFFIETLYSNTCKVSRSPPGPKTPGTNVTRAPPLTG